MPEAVRVEMYKQNAERLPVKHIGTPEEVAKGRMCLCISAHALTGGDSLPVCDEVLVHHRADRARRRRGNVHVDRLIHEVNNTRHVYLQAQPFSHLAVTDVEFKYKSYHNNGCRCCSLHGFSSSWLLISLLTWQRWPRSRCRRTPHRRELRECVSKKQSRQEAKEKRPTSRDEPVALDSVLVTLYVAFNGLAAEADEAVQRRDIDVEDGQEEPVLRVELARVLHTLAAQRLRRRCAVVRAWEGGRDGADEGEGSDEGLEEHGARLAGELRAEGECCWYAELGERVDRGARLLFLEAAGARPCVMHTVSELNAAHAPRPVHLAECEVQRSRASWLSRREDNGKPKRCRII
jgi:hypothetical protein